MADAVTLSRRRLVAAGAASGALAMAAAVASDGRRATARTLPAPSQDGVTEISFWKPPHGLNDAELFATLFEAFSQEHPNIRVTHNIVPWASVDESFTAAFAGGDPPDVFYLPDEWYPKYAVQGQIADLTPMFGDLQEEYDPNLWAAGTYQDTLYGIPFLAVIHALLLNMSLFEEAGLAAPQTWSDIEEAATTLADTSQGRYGFEIPSETGWTQLTALLAAGGARVLSEDLTQVAADTPGGVAAWEAALERIAWEDQAATPLSFTIDQRLDLSLRGQIAMMWREQSQVATWRAEAPDITLDVMPLPPVDGSDGQPAVWTNSGFLFMAEGSAHKDQAAELIRFLASRRVQEEYVVNGVNLISPMVGISTDDEDPLVAKYLSLLPQGVGPEMSVHWADAAQALRQESQAVVTGQKDAAQALADFAAIVEPTLDGE
ncbi:MAG: sugar ABC transporter substrate-binding protein [Chloroflexia bacterium]|nr:sugar ABC transporter substrate-binding protein [Chloroflexia bacterium]